MQIPREPSTMASTQRLRDRKVKDLTAEKRRLVEVPYTATLAHTMNALVANRVIAVAVAAPPGQWIGAGGSMIMESDKQTGAIRKHYIGMVTMLDILAHIAEGDDGMDGSDFLDRKMSVAVSTIIGHCLEGLSLWTLNPSTSLFDCMEVFSKGVHRALVPLDSHVENISGGVELVESASGYHMLTQMDVLKFLKLHAGEIKDVLSRSVGELGAVTETVYGVTDRAKVMEAIRCMRTASLNAVPIVEASSAIVEDHSQLVNGNGRKLIGTISATDLKGCPITQLQAWLPLTAAEFTEKFTTTPFYEASDLGITRELVTCYMESRLAEVMDKAVARHVHRVWVVDHHGLLVGLVSLTDMIRVVRASLALE